jgi:hypothetical protein
MESDCLTAADRERIAAYLEKPARDRTVDDLVPADEEPAGS